MRDYEPIVCHREGTRIFVDGFPERVAFSPELLGCSDLETVSTLITVSAANGEATYRVVDFRDRALIAEKL